MPRKVRNPARRAVPAREPDWAEDTARRILARAAIRARREGRTEWDAAKRELANYLASAQQEPGR